MSVDAKLSKLVKNQFPEFYQEEGENFLAFMEAYYAWMEENDQLTDSIRNLESYRDISTTTDDYIDYIYRTLLPSVPKDVVGDKKIMAKYIKEFNQSRGTFASYKLMFRAIYGEDIELSLPADQILKVSDGEWKVDRYLVAEFDKNTYNFIGKTIVGADSGAEALVEDVVRRTIRGVDLMQILLTRIVGVFNDKEPIRLKSDTDSSGHITTVTPGIKQITVTASGGGYVTGDVVSIISDQVGEFAKVIIRDTIDLGGTISFAVTDGGSGYRASSTTPGSTVSITGGDGVGATFGMDPDDITNAIALYLNLNRINDTTLFGTRAPSITNSDGIPREMTLFSNTIIASTRYGFPETSSDTGNQDFHDHINAVLSVGNTASDPSISSGTKLYGVSTGANAEVVSVITTNSGSNTVCKVDGYKNFSDGELIKITTSSGTTIGHVAGFSANTAGGHMLNLTVSGSVAVNDELRGGSSQTYGVVKTKRVEGSNTYLYVTANTTANLTSQFDTGPLKPFTSGETVYTVGTGATVGTVNITSSNSIVEDVHTRLDQSLLFDDVSVGTISALSDVDGGENYSIVPTVSVQDTDVSSLQIREYYLTLQSDDENWETGNSNFTTLASADKIIQGATSGYVVGGEVYGDPISVTSYSNGTYETTVRVWQDVLQSPLGDRYSNNGLATLETYAGVYTLGDPVADSRTQTNSGNSQIIAVQDNGIIGDNATITPSVGADGAIVSFRLVDSGFNYRDGEEVTLSVGSGADATEAQATLTLGGAANSEGYYASSRSHISSLSAYLQDGEYYQEYSYEILSPIALDRYRDIALKLCHPAGQKLFGKYRLQSNNIVNVSTATASKRRIKATGTVALANTSNTITGTSTLFGSEFTVGGEMILEYSHRSFYTIPINSISSNTVATMPIAWANVDISSANIYYTSTSAESANIYYQVT